MFNTVYTYISSKTNAFPEVYSASDLAKKFKGWSEERSRLIYPGKFNEYRRHQKRAVASSVGYNGKHYLRAYVELYKGTTDTGFVYSATGFTKPSGWAYMKDYPVIGRARAMYKLP